MVHNVQDWGIVPLIRACNSWLRNLKYIVAGRVEYHESNVILIYSAVDTNTQLCAA